MAVAGRLAVARMAPIRSRRLALSGRVTGSCWASQLLPCPEPILLGSSTPASIKLRSVAATLAVAISSTVDVAELGPWLRGAFGEIDAALAASVLRSEEP